MPGAHRTHPPALRNRPSRNSLSICTASQARWGQTLRRHAPGCTPAPGWRNRSSAAPCVDPARTLHVRFQMFAATKYFYALQDGEVPLCFLFSGTIFYAGGRRRPLQIAQISWEKELDYRLSDPGLERDDATVLPECPPGSVCARMYSTGCTDIKWPAGCRPGNKRWKRCWTRIALMNQALVDKVVQAVLYEGYILYPYRPSVKNHHRWTFWRTVSPALTPRPIRSAMPGRCRRNALYQGIAKRRSMFGRASFI